MIFRSEKEKAPEKHQYALNIGLTRPAGQGVVEFLVVGRKESYSQNKVIEFLSGHGAELVAHYGYLDAQSGDFILSCCVDVSRVDCTLDELLIRLRKMKFVTKAEKSEMKGQLFSSLLFPIQVLGLHRALLIDVDSIASVDEAMRGDEPRKISKILFDEGRNALLKVYDELKNLERLGSGKSAADATKDYLRASGWGLINFRTEGEFAFATVIDPPVSGAGKSSIAGVSYLSGMAAGVLERMVGSKMHFRYSNYEQDRQMMTLCLGKVELQTVVANSSPLEESLPTENANHVPSEGSILSTLISDLRNFSILEKIITAAGRGASKVNLMQAGKLSHSEANSLLQDLTKRGLLEVRKDSNFGTDTYFGTPRGEEFIDLCERITDMLLDAPRARATRHGTIIRGYQ
ncbi:MAG: hypothetical protein ACREBQ_06580 [Nitrososphaerales archaeon]